MRTWWTRYVALVRVFVRVFVRVPCIYYTLKLTNVNAS